MRCRDAREGGEGRGGGEVFEGDRGRFQCSQSHGLGEGGVGVADLLCGLCGVPFEDGPFTIQGEFLEAAGLTGVGDALHGFLPCSEGHRGVGEGLGPTLRSEPIDVGEADGGAHIPTCFGNFQGGGIGIDAGLHDPRDFLSAGLEGVVEQESIGPWEEGVRGVLQVEGDSHGWF